MDQFSHLLVQLRKEGRRLDQGDLNPPGQMTLVWSHQMRDHAVTHLQVRAVRHKESMSEHKMRCLKART